MRNQMYDDVGCVFMIIVMSHKRTSYGMSLVTKIIPTTMPRVTILTYVLEILGQIYKYSFSCTMYIQMYIISFNLQIKVHPACP